jgi:hypothetical protein
VADIYEYFEGFTPAPLLRSFAGALEALDIDVDTFIAAHGTPKSWAQFQEAVAGAGGPG